MDAPQHNLQNIPLENFLHICSYLDGRQALPAMSQVCTGFQNVLSDDLFWKSRIKGRWLPYHEDDVNVDWQRASTCIETESCYLSKPAPTARHIRKSGAHGSDIHALHILEGGEKFITGSRDATLCIWSASDDNQPLFTMPQAHRGWVWRISSASPEQIFTGSFDYSIKQWNLTPTGLSEVTSFSTISPVMSLQVLPERHLIAAGLVQGVVLMDYRIGSEPVHYFSTNKKNMLAMSVFDNNTIVASGLQRLLSVFDLRTNSEHDSNFTICEYPGHTQCMTVQRGLLYVGDTEGQIHIVDVANVEPKRLQTYSIGHKENILSMYSSYTTLVTASNNGNIRFWRHVPPPANWGEPNRPLKSVGLIQPDQGDISGMHFRDNVLVASVSKDLALNWWLP